VRMAEVLGSGLYSRGWSVGASRSDHKKAG
jgi:hypothetical protein